MVLTEVTEVAEEMAATAVRMELVVKVQAMAGLVVAAVFHLRWGRTVTEVGAEMLAIVVRLVEPAEPKA
jgi:ABC-type tungstate transport system substrate-binding protein